MSQHYSDTHACSMGLIVFYVVFLNTPHIHYDQHYGWNQCHRFVNGLVRVGLYWTSRSKTSPYANDLIGLERNFIIKRFTLDFESKETNF